MSAHFVAFCVKKSVYLIVFQVNSDYWPHNFSLNTIIQFFGYLRQDCSIWSESDRGPGVWKAGGRGAWGPLRISFPVTGS